MLNRRQLLARGCQMGAASAYLGSGLLSLGYSPGSNAQIDGDYRALVCILLAGGNDSYNMLVPYDAQTYGAYADIRGDLALPRETLLALDGTDSQGRRFGLHPGMPGVRDLFASGQAALLSGVGTLLAPLDINALASGQQDLPLGLFSHSDQIQQWQTAVSDLRIAQGWGGRIADILENNNPANGISMNISLSGNNIFQSGNTTTPYAISSVGDGAPALNGYNDVANANAPLRATIETLLNTSQTGFFRQEYQKRLAGATQAQEVFVTALNSVNPPAGDFSNAPFSAALAQIARVINARVALGASRQTFFVTVGGWDHHDDVIENQAQMLPAIDAGLSEFQSALNGMGVARQVTTFTTSDFGRTLTSNGQGSDHGWGGHHIIMGGDVMGGRFFGDYPDIYPGNPLDVGRGIYAPTTSVDEYFAELALWFGVSAGDLGYVLPNAERFFSAASGGRPLGFLA